MTIVTDLPLPRLNGGAADFARRGGQLRISFTPRCQLGCWFCHNEGEIPPRITHHDRSIQPRPRAMTAEAFLLRRANTGFADGSWSVPGGCLNEGETLPAAAAREAHEELGINIDPADLVFAHLCHHADPDGQARVGVFFAAHRWTGEPVNAEPDMCSEIGWHHPDSLPPGIVSYIRTGLLAYTRQGVFSLDGW